MKKQLKGAELLPPSDSKVYTRARKVIVRSEDQLLITVNVPKEMKISPVERRNRTDRAVASLVAWAIAYQEKTGWRHIHKAMTEEEVAELQLLGDKYPKKPKLYPEL